MKDGGKLSLTPTLVFIAVADLNIEVGAPEKKNRTFEFNLKCKIYLNVYSEDWCYKKN